jgi:hypothetical protein
MLKLFENRSAGRSLAGPYKAKPLQVCCSIASLPAHAASPHCPRMRMPRGPRMGASLDSPHRPRMLHRPPAITSARLLGISLPSCGRSAAPAQAPLPARAPLATDRSLRRDPVTGLAAPQLQVSILASPARTLSAGACPASHSVSVSPSLPLSLHSLTRPPPPRRRVLSPVLDTEPRRLP